MPLGVGTSDRKLLLVGGALLVLLLAATVVLSPPEEQAETPSASTYSADPGGAEAAYRLLGQLHYSVRRWEESPAMLPSEPGNILLILAEPTQPPSDHERQLLGDFVRGGGHVLFTGQSLATFFLRAELSVTGAKPKREIFSPVFPSALGWDAQRVSFEPTSYWRKLDDSQLALYGDADSPVVVSWNLGLGEILWWASSTPLTNAGIRLDDNLNFFLNSVGRGIAGAPFQIYWDEYFHGERTSLWSYVGKSSLAWGLAQLGLLALATLFAFSRRSGPIYALTRVSRLSPLEFVDTLGGLYERAGAAATAVSVSRLRLRFLLSRQFALPSDAPDAEVARLAAERLGWRDAALEDVLKRASAAARDAKLRPRQALELIQDLERLAAKMEVRGPRRQEES